MTLLHLSCGGPMWQLTPISGGMPDPDRSVAWCPRCTDPKTSASAGDPQPPVTVTGQRPAGRDQMSHVASGNRPVAASGGPR